VKFLLLQHQGYSANRHWAKNQDWGENHVFHHKQYNDAAARGGKTCECQDKPHNSKLDQISWTFWQLLNIFVLLSSEI
jgi:hypothetical protein